MTAPSPVKLILDAHHSRHAAEQLRAAGHDVIAAADDPVLAMLTDEELLTWSTKEERAIVTENARDLDRIAHAWAAAGASPRRHHLHLAPALPPRQLRVSRAISSRR